MAFVSRDQEQCLTCLSCLRNCPVKAIALKSKKIVDDRCIHCGVCITACPENHYLSENIAQFEKIPESVRKIALVSPLLASAMVEYEPERIAAALCQIGFEEIYLADSGMQLLAERYLDQISSSPNPPVISSFCPPVVEYIEKYCVDLIGGLARTLSPEAACAKYLAERMPRSKIVLITACPARSHEFSRVLPGACSITFSDLARILADKKINPGKLPRKGFQNLSMDSGSTMIAEGGFARAIMELQEEQKPEVVTGSGFEEVRKILESVRRGELKSGMVELSFCSGGCAGSPEIINRLSIWQKTELAENFLKSRKIAESNRLKIIPSPGTNWEAEFRAKRVQPLEPANEKLKDALTGIGIGPKMPNCKVCGYNSCDEFAAALIRGEADPAFCFPALAKRMTRMDEKFLRSERLASVGQIAAGLAHEVNNPLGLASGYAQTLFKDEELSDQAKQTLVLIRDEIENAASIIQNFLNLARERPARFETVNFYDVLAATLRLVAPRLEASGIALILDYIPEPLLLDCDSYGLQQVFTNIVLNAWQAMPEGGKLFISVRALPDQVVVKFRDVGVGIKSEHIPKLFDPFFTTKPPGMGTGLGLTIAYKIIEQHKGDIQASSEPGKGAEFVITLPRAPAKKQSEGVSG